MNDFITFRVRNSTVLIKIDPLFPRAQRPARPRAVRGLLFGLRQGDLPGQHLPRARASLEQALLQQLRETIGADGAIISYETAAETTGNVLTVTLTAECEQEIGRAQATPDAEFLQLRPPAGEGTTADD